MAEREPSDLPDFVPESLKVSTKPEEPADAPKHRTFRLTTKAEKPLTPEDAKKEEKSALEKLSLTLIVISVFTIYLAWKNQSFLLLGCGIGVLLPSLKKYFKS